MSNVPMSKRRESGFDVVDTAEKIYSKVLGICLRMPNRYTYLILQDLLKLAGEVADFTAKADSISYASTPYIGELDICMTHFLQARASLKALIKRMNFFILRPESVRKTVNGKEIGITISELNELSDLMKKENDLLNRVISSGKQKRAVLVEKHKKKNQ